MHQACNNNDDDIANNITEDVSPPLTRDRGADYYDSVLLQYIVMHLSFSSGGKLKVKCI